MLQGTLRRRSFWLLGLLALVLAACGADKRPPLTGVVLDQYSQQPIAGATVQVADITATTDAQGRFRVETWKPEDSVVVQATDYVSNSLSLIDKQPADAQTTEIDASLNLRPDTVQGVVTDEYTNQPLADVQVQTTNGLSATTDAEGRYRLSDVPETFTLTFSKADYAGSSVDVAQTTSADAVLRPSTLSGVVTDKYSSQPIADAAVRSGDSSATTDAEGRYKLTDVSPDQDVEISATDYTSQTLTIPAATTTLDAVLRPSTVRGVVTNSETGEPVDRGAVLAILPPYKGADPTQPYTGNAVSLTRLNSDGSYALQDVPEGTQIQVLVPGYRKGFTTFTEGEFKSDVAVEPFAAKAVYITAATASSRDALSELFDLVDNTELNAVVIDIKLDIAGDVGGVGYLSNHPLVQEAGTAEDYLDMPWIVQEAHRRNIYIIGRMAVMRDNRLADAKPEWAAQSAVTGGVWEDGGGLKWMDPFNPNVAEYNIGIAEEIANYGFDEVQFDYIRFPSDGVTSNLVFSQPIDPANNPEPMYETIGGILAQAHDRINSAGAFFSIDVFGYATWRNMWEIGQSLEVMGNYTDYVCAMVYPSHYDRNELGFDNADAHPYEIVKDSIEKGQVRLDGKYALQRPWLQGFTATWLSPTVRYGRDELQAQMQAVQEVPGTHGWTIWNAANDYDPNWFN